MESISNTTANQEEWRSRGLGKDKMSKSMGRRKGRGDSEQVRRLTWHIPAGLWDCRLRKKREFDPCFPDHVHGFEFQVGFPCILFKAYSKEQEVGGEWTCKKHTINAKFFNLLHFMSPQQTIGSVLCSKICI